MYLNELKQCTALAANLGITNYTGCTLPKQPSVQEELVYQRSMAAIGIQWRSPYYSDTEMLAAEQAASNRRAAGNKQRKRRGRKAKATMNFMDDIIREMLALPANITNVDERDIQIHNGELQLNLIGVRKHYPWFDDILEGIVNLEEGSSRVALRSSVLAKILRSTPRITVRQIEEEFDYSQKQASRYERAANIVHNAMLNHIFQIARAEMYEDQVALILGD